MKPKIAFLGVGLMGYPMAVNLINAGYQVSAWNRTYKKLLPLKNMGGQILKSPALAVKDADIICTMLENVNAVEEVLFNEKVLNNLKVNKTVVDMSSIPPESAQSHNSRLKKLGICHIDAPVSGGTTGAQDGTLAIMAGGEAEVFDKIYDFFNPLGKATLVGPSGSGQLTKLANQIICGGYLTAVAEGLTLAASGGADLSKVREALMGGFAESKVLQIHGKRMVDRTFEPGGKCHIFLKDLRTVLLTAENMNLDLPTAKTTTNIYNNVVNNLGLGELDQAASILAIESLNTRNSHKDD